MNTRFCLDCGRQVSGRVDKKFCSDQCRSSYNNRMNTANDVNVRRIQKKLLRNRKILERFLEGKEYRLISVAEIIASGYSMEFLTHLSANTNGVGERFCFEFRIGETSSGDLEIRRA